MLMKKTNHILYLLILFVSTSLTANQEMFWKNGQQEVYNIIYSNPQLVIDELKNRNESRNDENNFLIADLYISLNQTDSASNYLEKINAENDSVKLVKKLRLESRVSIVRGDTKSASNKLKEALEIASFTDNKNQIYNIYLELTYLFIQEQKIEKAQIYLDQAFFLFSNSNLKIESSIDLHLLQGKIYTYTGNYEEAKEHLEKAFEASEKPYDKVKTNICFGRLYLEQNKFELSSNRLFEALKMTNEIKHELFRLVTLNLLSELNFRMEAISKSFNYASIAYDLAEEWNNNEGIIKSSLLLTKILMEQNKYKMALKYANSALKKSQSWGDSGILADSYEVFGMVNTKLANFEIAEEAFGKTLQLRERIYDKKGIGNLQNNYGKLEIRKGNIESALSYFNKALQTHNEIDNLEGKTKTVFNIHIAYKKIGNYQKALEYLNSYIELKEKLLSENSKSKIVELQTIYETEKQKSENLKLKMESTLEREEKYFWIKIFALSMISGIIIIIVVSNRYLIKSKLNKKLKDREKELDSLNNKLEHKNEKLRESNYTKDKFYSLVAHDLKNPFTTIIGLCELVLDKTFRLSSEDKEHYVESIKKSAQNTYNLLENLLEWSRTQSQGIRMNKVNFVLNDLVNESIEVLKTSAEEKEIVLNNYVSDAYVCNADYSMIGTVVRNLVSNAIKFTNRNGMVIIDAKEENRNIRLSVSDTGIGIDKEKLENLFSLAENVSSEGTENEPGTGLGLKLSYEFIVRNEGSIWAENNKDKGTTFYISIPKFTVLKKDGIIKEINRR